ncbi:MAG: nucleotide exchange factor GrpE [Clostridiales bacterium]|nr:nucleotide exchange factor GrpE [Clostridiales bacterium]
MTEENKKDDLNLNEEANDELKEKTAENSAEKEAETAEEPKTAEDVANENTPSKEEQLEAKIAELNDRLLRNLAEFDNYRKRTTLEKSAMYSAGTADAAEKLLPVLDNFERALSSEKDKENSLYKGVEMIFKQMTQAFKDMGISEIEAEGQTFDPNFHNAVMHIEDESLGENVVSQVLQKGYKYNDRVIRPAMVQVAN